MSRCLPLPDAPASVLARECACPAGWTGRSDEIPGGPGWGSPSCAVNETLVRVGYGVLGSLMAVALLGSVGLVGVLWARRDADRGQWGVAGLFVLAAGTTMSMAVVRAMYPTRVLGVDMAVTLLTAASFTLCITCGTHFLIKMTDFMRSLHNEVAWSQPVSVLLAVVHTLPVILGGPVIWVAELAWNLTGQPDRALAVALTFVYTLIFPAVVDIVALVMIRRVRRLLVPSPSSPGMDPQLRRVLFSLDVIALGSVLFALGLFGLWLVAIIPASRKKLFLGMTYVYLFCYLNWAFMFLGMLRLQFRKGEFQAMVLWITACMPRSCSHWYSRPDAADASVTASVPKRVVPVLSSPQPLMSLTTLSTAAGREERHYAEEDGVDSAVAPPSAMSTQIPVTIVFSTSSSGDALALDVV